MEFSKSHAGNWVAIKGKKVIDMGRNLHTLVGRMNKRKDRSEIGYSKIPKGAFTGLA